MSVNSIASKALEQGKGVMRLAPNWVPRSFCVPGRRIKLHPDDYYALGGERGGIDERWFASTTPADNGPLTSKDEGLSFITFEDFGKIEKVLLLDAVAELKGEIIGERFWAEHDRWPMYSKFFDNKGALSHHIHHRGNHTLLTCQLGKPEAHYFSPQENNYGGDFPYTFFGLNPGTTKEQACKVLFDFENGKIIGGKLSNEYERLPLCRDSFDEISLYPDWWYRRVKHHKLEIQLIKPGSYDSRAQLNNHISDPWIPSYFHTYEKSFSCERTDGIYKLSDDPLAVKTRQLCKRRGIDQHDMRRHSPGTRHKVTTVPVAKPKDNDGEGNLVRSKKIVIKIKKERTITIQIGQSLANRLGKLHWPFNLLFKRFLHKLTTDPKGQDL